MSRRTNKKRTLKRKNYKTKKNRKNKNKNKNKNIKKISQKFGGADEVGEDTSPTPKKEIYNDMLNYFN